MLKNITCLTYYVNKIQQIINFIKKHNKKPNDFIEILHYKN